MTKKYIIKNCPAFCDVDDDWNCISRDTEELKCQDYTDCLLKQIVERLKLYQYYRAIDKQVGMAADDVLSMLEIEECEE